MESSGEYRTAGGGGGGEENKISTSNEVRYKIRGQFQTL